MKIIQTKGWCKKMKIIKQELQFEKCLKQRIEFICESSKVTPTFRNGSIRKLEKTNLTYTSTLKILYYITIILMLYFYNTIQ